jgi:hypothetical protein
MKAERIPSCSDEEVMNPNLQHEYQTNYALLSAPESFIVNVDWNS